MTPGGTKPSSTPSSSTRWAWAGVPRAPTDRPSSDVSTVHPEVVVTGTDVVVVVVVVVGTLATAGWNVATNGVCTTVGSTTGIFPTAMVTEGTPIWTETVPAAWITCLTPGCTVPAHKTDPVDTVVACTQLG